MLQALITTLLAGLFYTIHTTFWLGLWLFGLGVLLTYLLRWWPGDRLLPVRLLNYMIPWPLIPLVLALIAAGLARRHWLVTVLAIPTLFISLTHAPLFLPRPCLALTDREGFKVLSYNVGRHNLDVTAMAALIRQEQPDILLLQELRRDRVEALINTLDDLYPDAELHFTYDPYTLQAMASRYPLTPLAIMAEKGRAQKVLLETPNGPVTVINAHTYFPDWQGRYEEMSALLAEDIIPTDGPLILGGDFNTTDQTQIYRMVNQQLHNAHREAGWGLGFTFPVYRRRIRGIFPLPPMVRIDHIFYSDHFFANNAGTLTESGGSDHLSVYAELSWIKN
jgi:endonuclease/exonuclease/phosphatase (EEP) superfamily protein YafD